jgi:pimeloyl-ACP methyl ester carboxylesterase
MRCSPTRSSARWTGWAGRAPTSSATRSGYVALQLASRGRAETVVALSPAGGFAPDDVSYRATIVYFEGMLEAVKGAAPNAEAILASPNGPRRVTDYTATNFEHIPVDLLAHQIRGAARCDAGLALLEHEYRVGLPLEAEKIACPVRIAWGTSDRIHPWPSAAARYLDDWLPDADYVELEGIGHCPQLDIPRETARLILGFTSGRAQSSFQD